MLEAAPFGKKVEVAASIWENMVYYSSNLSVWSSKHCNCFGRSIILVYVNIEHKINLTFCSQVKS